MNELAKHNSLHQRTVEQVRDERKDAHRRRQVPGFGDYPLVALKNRIADALSARWGEGRLTPQIEVIDRDTFGGDLALKFPELLAKGGPKAFIQNHQAWIVEVLRSAPFADTIAAVHTKGMYINVTLSNHWLLSSAQAVVDRGPQFGFSDIQHDRVVLVDYSSPNVAKVLHAGHIRSTLIGHVLCNLHEACGALVYRVNHINDFGGFGFTLEGYRRFADRFPAGMTDNDRLLEIYRIRRTLERLIDEDAAIEQLEPGEREVLQQYFPGAPSKPALAAENDRFVEAAERRFAALEQGDAGEVGLWQRMVQWSLGDFEQFYESLNIHIDFVIGESFYAEAGQSWVDECLRAGTALVYDSKAAAADEARLDAMRARDEITEAERDSQAELIKKDVGAVVVLLEGLERLVVRRADGRSIYATRDLGAIRVRRALFDPTHITYVVGQEQRIHFSRLFKAAYRTGLASEDRLHFLHVYFGFYVDGKSGRKLSSRNSVANVNQLLRESIAHFRARTALRGDLTDEELDHTARQLAIGSVVFNDLKQDVKGSVEIDTTALDATIAGFEKSGGAYVVYTACRARSILRKYGHEPEHVSAIADPVIDNQEALLLLRLQQIPERLAAAAEQANPTLLIRHLLDVASIYNSYYMRAQVVTEGVANPARLLITKAVELSLTTALKVCHIECPPKI